MYRRVVDGTLLRCLEKEESDQVLVDMHEGICGGHSNGLSMAQRLLRVEYYWPMMQIDAVAFAKSCEKYQINGNLIHALGRELIPFISHWPFQNWPLTLLEKFIPTHQVDTSLLSLLLITSLNG